MELVINQLLTPEVAEKLGITPDNVIFLGNGYDNGKEKFVVIDGYDEVDPKFCHPCKFTIRGSQALNYKIPPGSLTNMANIFGDKNVKHPVQITIPNLFERRGEDLLSISQMEKYFQTLLKHRRDPKAMLHIPVAQKDRWSFHPPELLRNDLSCGRQIGYPDDDNGDSVPLMMDLMASMIGQGSLFRFHCHKDDSTIWVNVAQGIKVYFFLLNPTSDDLEFVKECNVPSLKGNLMSDSMSGRVICCVLEAGESLIFQGSVPHAMYASNDVLSYGGHFLVPTMLDNVIKFTKANPSYCLGHGYTYEQVINMIHGGLGGIWYTLWRMKFHQPKDFDKCFNMAGDIINEVIYNHRSRLNITKAKERWVKAFYLSLYNVYTTTFIPSIFGVFYSKNNRIQIVTAFDRVLRGKHFIPALTNVVDGLPFRSMDPPHPDDLDYDANVTDSRAMSIDDIFPDLLTANYGACAGICEGSFGMFASYDLPKHFAVAQFTGHLRTNKQLDAIYGVKQHPGKIYFLQERVGKNGKNQNVFIDSNQYGSFSLIVKTSNKPNCRLRRVSVEKRLILVVYTGRKIHMGEELLIPEPMFPESHADGLVSIDRYIKGLEKIQEITLSFDEPDHDLQDIIQGEDEPVEIIQPTVEMPATRRRIRNQVFLERVRRYRDQRRLYRTTGEIIERLRQEPNKLIEVNSIEERQCLPDEKFSPVESDEDDQEDQTQRRQKSKVPKSTKKRHKVMFELKKVSQESPVPPRKPVMFEFNGQMHELYHIPQYPHAIIEPLYNTLSKAEKEALKNKLVALFYPSRSNYIKMNNDLLQRYHQLVGSRACAICAHLGLPIEGFAHKPMNPLSSPQKFKEHYERFHEHRFQCETCNEWYDNGRERKGHYDTMIKYQKDPAHIKDYEIRKEIQNKEKEAKAKAKAEKKKKKDQRKARPKTL